MRITENINNYISFDACSGPSTMEVGKPPAGENRPASENEGSQAKNDCETEIKNLEY